MSYAEYGQSIPCSTTSCRCLNLNNLEKTFRHNKPSDFIYLVKISPNEFIKTWLENRLSIETPQAVTHTTVKQKQVP